MKYKYTKEDLEKAVIKSLSIAQVCRELGIRPVGGNYKIRGKSKLSASSERRNVEYLKFRETLTGNADGNPEPSLSNKEGAETLRDTPKSKDMVKRKSRPRTNE